MRLVVSIFCLCLKARKQEAGKWRQEHVCTSETMLSTLTFWDPHYTQNGRCCESFMKEGAPCLLCSWRNLNSYFRKVTNVCVFIYQLVRIFKTENQNPKPPANAEDLASSNDRISPFNHLRLKPWRMPGEEEAQAGRQRCAWMGQWSFFFF